MTIANKIKELIRDVKDFPQEGIIFKDLTPLLLHPILCSQIVEEFVQQFKTQKIDAICAIESRGFLFGMLLAQKLNIPFIPVRKKGKLPGPILSYSYDLEYGSSTVEIHIDDVQPGWNILIHDDLLATGGTAIAASELLKMCKANVIGYAFIIELSFLNGRQKLNTYSNNLISLVNY